MTKTATMDTIYFDDTPAEEGIACEVRMGNGEIVVSYEEEGGFVNYTGREISEGHFQLECAVNGGKASLHCFKDGNILEGFWIEAGSKGFWRISFQHVYAMKLDIQTDKTYYKSNVIQHGSIISDFFEKLTKNIFHQAYKYLNHYKTITGNSDLPLLYNEKTIYSTIAVAIDKVTPVHLSEWSFNKNDYDALDQARIVDFWCLYKNGTHGRPLNVFIEVKKNSYNLDKASKKEFQQSVIMSVKTLISQMKILKNDISPNWEGIDDIFLGLSIIHGVYLEGEEYYDIKQVHENIHNIVHDDCRHHLQLITATWFLPKQMDIPWETYKCKFITIAGVILSKKKC